MARHLTSSSMLLLLLSSSKPNRNLNTHGWETGLVNKLHALTKHNNFRDACTQRFIGTFGKQHSLIQRRANFFWGSAKREDRKQKPCAVRRGWGRKDRAKSSASQPPSSLRHRCCVAANNEHASFAIIKYGECVFVSMLLSWRVRFRWIVFVFLLSVLPVDESSGSSTHAPCQRERTATGRICSAFIDRFGARVLRVRGIYVFTHINTHSYRFLCI